MKAPRVAACSIMNPQLDAVLGEKAASTASTEASAESPREFQVPLHYPRYTREDYESMSEELLDRLFEAYGLSAAGQTLEAKRNTAIRTFLWEANKKDDKKEGEKQGPTLLRKLSSLCRQVILGEEP